MKFQVLNNGGGPGAGTTFSPPKLSISQIFLNPLLAYFDARNITGLADGAAVASMTNLINDGYEASQSVSAKQPIYKKTAWSSDGGPCVQFTAANTSSLRLDSLANLFGSTSSGSKPFAVAMLLRPTANVTGALFGFGSNSDVNAQYGVQTIYPTISKTGGSQGNVSNSVNLRQNFVWAPYLGSTVAEDTIIVFNVDQTAKVIFGAANNGSGLIRLTIDSAYGLGAGLYGNGQTITVVNVGGTTEANGTWKINLVDHNHIDLQGSTFSHTYTSGGYVQGSGFVWCNGQRLSLETGVDDINTYQNLTIGALLMNGTYYEPFSFNMRAAVVKNGIADDRWIAAMVQYWNRTDLLRHTIRIDGDSIPAYNLDGGTGPWPSLVSLLPNDISYNYFSSVAATLVNEAVGGRSIADLAYPNGFPDGNNSYINGESATNIFNYSSIYGLDVVGIIGVDPNGTNNYQPEWPLINCVFVSHHELARLYSPRQTADRYWYAFDLLRSLAPNNFYVAATCLPAVQTGWIPSNAIAFNNIIAAEYAAHCDDFIDWRNADPLLQNPLSSAYYTDNVHLSSSGRTLAAAFFTSQLPRIRARCNGKYLTRMMNNGGINITANGQ